MYVLYVCVYVLHIYMCIMCVICITYVCMYTRVVGRQPHAPAAFTPRRKPWYSFLEAVYVRMCVCMYVCIAICKRFRKT